MAKNEKIIMSRIDKQLHEKFKIACIKSDRQMKDVIAELIKEWLKKPIQPK